MNTQEEINDFHNYYTSLYKAPDNGDLPLIQQFLSHIQLPRVTQPQYDLIEDPITADEISESIKQLATGKTPGTDGWPSEFYSAYSKQLIPRLSNMYEEAFERGELPPSLRERTLVVLPKPGRDPLQMASYRPVSLLNADYKILGKILANRLMEAIPVLIHEGQNGFIPGRNTGLNLRRLFKLLDWACTEIDTPWIAAQDIEKAYDTLGWQYLLALLSGFGMGPNFLR